MNNLDINYYDYSLPQELIAQSPPEDRASSRLMLLSREDGSVGHDVFSSICRYLKPGDCLVLNNTKVMQARMSGLLNRGTEASPSDRVEFLLVRRVEDSLVWEVMVKPGKRARVGDRILFADGVLSAEVLDILRGGTRLVRFSSPVYGKVSVCDQNHFFRRVQSFTGKYLSSAEFIESLSGNLSEDFYKIISFFGSTPLPPYIKKQLGSPERYQTVYAKNIGSAAAPTAGLHFTDSILSDIRSIGVKTAFVTLHVGPGTFQSVKSDDISQHIMHEEYFEITPETAEIINSTKLNGGRIVCVGTTSVRTLETASDDRGLVEAKSGFTGIFIYPPYRFKTADCIITNFHLPKSTLIMLISAFAGRDLVMDAYREAIAEKYRFFSFGDCMLIF